ncbi:hypothetical protein LMG28138_06028 [Pararobbsia alpina]|uniref:Uncharacterized protein n=1 Tax=Pararobbsia alpina TaxID=621374 RepID=A0A6S7DI44_9BURK|nr:hypothetical protein LMG28138_06028 [Pararobbsia alpina]
MTLAQLLVGQGWAKIGVALTNDCQCLRSHALGQLVIARTISLMRNEARRAFAPVTLGQPFHLAPTDAQSLSGAPRHQ